MCDPASIALLVTTAVSTGTAIYQGEQQKDYNEYLAKQAEYDADTERQAAEIRAEDRRDQARRVAATARANLAASGVDIDSETANAINKDIIRRGELDALTGIDDSADTASRLRAQATALRLQGQQAQIAGYANATSAIARYGASSGWYGSGGSGATASAGS